MSLSGWRPLLAPPITPDWWLNSSKKVIFPYFGVPRFLINDNGAHFIEKKLEALLKKYRVRHKYRHG